LENAENPLKSRLYFKIITMPNANCMKKCLRKKTTWLVGGTAIAALVSALILLGVMFPGAGTVTAILIGLGLIAFVALTAIWDCWRSC